MNDNASLGDAMLQLGHMFGKMASWGPRQWEPGSEHACPKCGAPVEWGRGWNEGTWWCSSSECRWSSQKDLVDHMYPGIDQTGISPSASCSMDPGFLLYQKRVAEWREKRRDGE